MENTVKFAGLDGLGTIWKYEINGTEVPVDDSSISSTIYDRYNYEYTCDAPESIWEQIGPELAESIYENM